MLASDRAPAPWYREHRAGLIEQAHAQEHGSALAAAERAERLLWPVGHPNRGG